MVFNKLLDGTPTQKIYWTSKLNRFPKNGTCLDRRRIASPSKVSIQNKYYRCRRIIILLTNHYNGNVKSSTVLISKGLM